MLSKQQLEYFLMLYEHGSFIKTAEILGVSQPSLSVAIQQIEKLLGVKLFIRKKTGVQLTLAGEQLLPHAKKMFYDWLELVSAVTAPLNEIKGSIIIGCPGVLAEKIMPLLTTHLLKKQPHLTISCHCAPSHVLLEMLRASKVDMAIVVNQITVDPFIQKVLGQDKTAYWTAFKNLDLNSSKCPLFYDPNLVTSQEILKKTPKLTLQNLVLTACNDLHVIRELVKGGRQPSIAILPKSYAQRHMLHPVMPKCYTDDYINVCYRPECRDFLSFKYVVEQLKTIVSKLL